MIQNQQAIELDTSDHPTVWGLDLTQLHDRFWAARGVQVVRQGEPSEIVDDAELFLLTDPRLLCIFKMGRVIEVLSWEDPDVLWVRLHDRREHGYREDVVTDNDGRLVRFDRVYDGTDSRLARVALTSDPQIARLWQSSPDPRAAWRRLRQVVSRRYRSTTSVAASVFDRSIPREAMSFVETLMRTWKRPDASIARIRRSSPGIWQYDHGAGVTDTQLVGPLWIGAGRELDHSGTVVGPAVFWDDPDALPEIQTFMWREIQPAEVFERAEGMAAGSMIGRFLKRAFDIVFALIVLLVTLPICPIIMFLTWIEDGRPFFYAQQRETLGGRQFGCIKFRSMRRDADQIKLDLQQANQADGPQFFMDEDPRITRIGRVIRKLNLDELPQFIHVLSGQMSVVGPRPSPRQENQFCPQWREARLSVRPGITGLWQIKRSRRAGMDFQEWIMYDIEYVERASFWLDLYIIWRTVVILIRGMDRS
ncbi:MAG: hypothetical protein CMJ49_00600 [Planctomycetaceae bacterium]|nr:hypothetical protein [Planctomycetaceae bacterium]